ncbi:(Dimethylallyl)adenosine tRNA methylthiotransferase MiaB [bacterium BMS3Abin15]|nr:(Dimethylallyl)adenosine tRNA methylthiotransferase MiaB [bacterium BMS3Abin15]
MKVLFIWPKGFDTHYVLPLAFGYLTSNLDHSKHEIKIIDCSLHKLTSDKPELRKEISSFCPDIVGVSCWSTTYLEAIKILETVKSIDEDIITAMGGVHATTYPDRTMEHKEIDFLFRGEAEVSFPVFLDELAKEHPNYENVLGLIYRSNSSIINNPPERRDNIDEIKWADYDAIDLEGYINSGYRLHTTIKRNAPVWVTRGCPYRCTFCTAPLQNGKKVRTHSVEYMVRLVKHLYDEKNIRQINIIDDNFTFHTEYAKEFCRAIIALNLKDLRFNTPNGIRAQRTDKELLNLMWEAGWRSLIIAPESGSKKVLKKMQKDLDPDIVPEKVKEIREAGLKCSGFFIIGYPDETLEDMKETVSLIKKCRFNFFFLNNFQPLPGTPLYDELVRKGEIEDGLMPGNFSDGVRAYTPKALRTVNFPKLVLMLYLNLAFREPLNIPYMITQVNPRMIVEKVWVNLKQMILHWGRSKSNKLSEVETKSQIKS